MKELQELAESLERKKLVGAKLSLFGFALGGLFRILSAKDWPGSVNDLFLALQGIGVLIFLSGLIQLIIVSIRVRRDQTLKQLFNDELNAQTKMKTWKAGFIGVIIAQVVLIALSTWIDLGMLLTAEITVYVAFCASVGTGIIQEELLAIDYFYPEFDKEQYKVWNWKSFSFFHWIINPGVAFNELVLGQRVPKVMLIDRKSPKPLMERTYVPCPHCETIHNQSLWSHKNGNAFKNWFGLYCPTCGEVIPCLSNIVSRIILAITYPLWFWKKDEAKVKWLEKQREKFQFITDEPALYKDVPWGKMALGFGVTMFVIMTLMFQGILYFLNPKGDNFIEHYLDGPFLLLNAVIWTIGGMAFGLFIKYFNGKKSKEAGIDTLKEKA